MIGLEEKFPPFAVTGYATISKKPLITKSLSATVSKKFPNVVTILRFLAMCPSKKSVRHATAKMIVATSLP